MSINKSFRELISSAGVVEYTDAFSAERRDSANEGPRYETK